MVSLDEAVIARLKTHGENFEILVDPKLALKYRNDEDADFSELLAVGVIFKDSKTGEKVSEQSMNKIFKTNDVNEIAGKIIKKGDVHLTAEQRREILDGKRRRIISIISRESINPQTKAPHPPARIDKAMNEAKVHVDINKSAEGQVEGVLKEIRRIIPIKFECVDVAVKIPPKYAGGIQRVLSDFGKVKGAEWDKEGNMLSLIEIPAGLQDDLYGKINALTHGEGQVKVKR